MQLEAAARRERLAGALQHGDVGLRIAVDDQPHVGQLAVDRRADGVEPRPVERDPQHAVGGAVERQVGEGGVAVRLPSRSSVTAGRAAGHTGERTHGPDDPRPCTGNATRSVIAGAVLKAHLPDVEIATAGTMSIDGLPMSWRTRAGFESVGVTPPAHRSRQVRRTTSTGRRWSSAWRPSTCSGCGASTRPRRPAR